MKIVYLSNYFNHHQKFLSDELLKLTDGNYLFVETESLPQEKINLGYRKYAETYFYHYKIIFAIIKCYINIQNFCAYLNFFHSR